MDVVLFDSPDWRVTYRVVEDGEVLPLNNEPRAEIIISPESAERRLVD